MSKLNYQIRPSKHVERKLFVEVLTHLRELGCNISDYHYMGLGAPYFMDFLLFQKYLYITKMTSFESDPSLIGRVTFNKPLANINLIAEDATTAIPRLINEKEKYLIWLDYECTLNSDILDAVGILAGLVPEGSVMIITVNASLPPVYDDETLKAEVERYMELFSTRIPGIEPKDIYRNSLKSLYAKALKAEIDRVSLTRADTDFVQLFNYTYADGAPMFTFGGIVKARSDSFKEAVAKMRYVNQAEEPREISVPALTHKERTWLDAYISTTQRRRTGLSPADVDRYLEFAAHYPTYYEIAI